MTLYPHNLNAYEAVMKHFGEGNRKAAVIQSTGTGKSFVGGAVASHFEKVLVVAPNDYVLEQATSTTPHADTATYTFLSVREEMPTGYDLIWFDEFHRIGAPTWKGGVDRIIEANPQAKILGTTATPERALEQRNMADEFFDGDVVSTMTLADAWVNHILRVPKYIIGVVSMESTQADYKERINASKLIDSVKKQEITVRLDNVLRDWSYSHGVPRILHKYIDSGVERMIVFAQTINKLDEVVSSIRPWFNEAGIKLANIYTVHSSMGSEAKRQLQAFENDTTEGVKVLVSVDMLNEGIHVDRVDAVMLLRSTISKNIYMQQIGRCFAVGQKHQPIILDLADNLNSACGYDGIYNAQRMYQEYESEKDLDKEKDEFLVIDTVMSVRELIAEIDKSVSVVRNEKGYWTYERCKDEASKYERRNEFFKGCVSAYISSKQNGWLDEFFGRNKQRTIWTKEKCAAEALKYERRVDFYRNCKGAVSYAKKHGFYEDICCHMKKTFKTWTKEEIQLIASKYQTKREFEKNERAAYTYAYEHGILNDVCKHMTNKKHNWTIEECAIEAKKYTRRVDFQRGSRAAYTFAKRRGWLDGICPHMPKNVRKI